MTRHNTTPTDEIERVLRENGLTDQPGTYDSDIHSWRCSHPDIYGPCDCFQELRDDLARILAARGNNITHETLLREALTELVALKDGPRNAEYERRKPLAWEAARAALSPTPTNDTTPAATEGETNP